MAPGISEETKIKIAGFIEAKFSDSDIAKHFKVNRKTVWRIRKKINETGTVKRAAGQGRKRTIRTSGNVKRLREKVRRNNKRSFRKIAKEMEISEKSVRRIASDAGISSKTFLTRNLITENQKVKRVIRSTDLSNWMENNPEKIVLWTDESQIEFDSFKNKQTDRILMTSETPKRDRIRMKSKNPEKVMIFGLVGSDGSKMPLIFMPKGVTLSSPTYRTFILDEVVSWIRERYEPGQTILMQNGAPPHTSNVTQQFLTEQLGESGYWNKTQWPPSSPDLNPLDFSIWSILKQKACSESFPNRETLIRKLNEAWNKAITPEYIRKVCGSVQKRFRAVINANGGHIEGFRN